MRPDLNTSEDIDLRFESRVDTTQEDSDYTSFGYDEIRSLIKICTQ